MNIQIQQIYGEFVDFISSSPTLETLASYQISDQSNAYINTLLEANRNRRLTDSEADALVLYDHVEHVMTSDQP